MTTRRATGGPGSGRALVDALQEIGRTVLAGPDAAVVLRAIATHAMRAPNARSMAGRTLRTRRPYRIDDLDRDEPSGVIAVTHGSPGRERVALVGGTLEVRSTPRTTELELKVPATDPEGAE